MTVAAPVTASPPAYTALRVVRPSSPLVMMQPWLFVSRPGVVLRMSGFGLVPMDMTMQSTSSTNSLPSFTTGRRRPLASGSPSSISTQRMPHTLPSASPSTSTGFERVLKMIPSSTACSTSSLRAGSSFMLRRYTMYTFSAPNRLAQRAASMATLPPPTTATFLACWMGVFAPSLYAFIRLMRVRNSLAEYTPFRLSPGMPMNRGRPAPEPMNTASLPISNSSSMVIVLPMTTLVSMSTPSSFRPSISWRTISLGRRNSGMPYTSTPPAVCSASYTVTL